MRALMAQNVLFLLQGNLFLLIRWHSFVLDPYGIVCKHIFDVIFTLSLQGCLLRKISENNILFV